MRPPIAAPMRTSTLVCGTVAVLLFASPARAEPDVMPRRVQFKFDVLGVEHSLSSPNNSLIAVYYLHTDVSFRLLDRAVALWLGVGAGFGYGYPENLTGAITFDASSFLTLSFERLTRRRLVPFLRLGVAFDAGAWGHGTSYTAFGTRVGGGLDYWIRRWFGIGLESSFDVGKYFAPWGVFAHGESTSTGPFLDWKLNAGVRFGF